MQLILARLTVAFLLGLLSTGYAYAVSLGKIDVASHLGEPFYAEIPLILEEGESLSSIHVEVASPIDYRILEVYRDSVLRDVRALIESDQRGTRIEVSSRNPIDAPFFNLVLKVQHRRATHFRKYPVFLELPKAVRTGSRAAPLPTVRAVDSKTSPVSAAVVQPVSPAAKPRADNLEMTTTTSFKPFDGWARIGRYGPMVYGDTISTVAERLRIDDRYTRQQVMVALFEKNRSKFDQDNINLIKAGTYLDIPRAAEVERISPAQARSVIAEHEKRWRELKKQPRYAAVAEAQRTRYSKRIRVGKHANGVAAAPEGQGATVPGKAGAEIKGTKPTISGQAEGDAAAQATVAAAQPSTNMAENKKLLALEKENETLKQQLAASEKKIDALSAKAMNAQDAAAKERIKKLELQIARLRSALDQARAQQSANATAASSPDWMTWGLGGLVAVLLAIIGFLMRRQPKHPAELAAAVSAPVAGGGAEVATETLETPEIEVEEADYEEAVSATSEQPAYESATEESEPFTDSIPDLTDSDTAEMEPFEEQVEEEPDPNVDYLSEADVYLRYGMEDEALKQVKLAKKLDATNPDVYAKMALIHKARGDEEAFNSTFSEASQILKGDSLLKFKSAIASVQTGEDLDEGFHLEDTLPPTEADETIATEISSEEQSLDLDETMAELDKIDLAHSEETISSEASSGVEISTGELTALADEQIDTSEFEMGSGLSLDVEEEEKKSVSDTTEEPEEAGDKILEQESDEKDVISSGVHFDLTDVEIPQVGEEAEKEGEEVATSDLEKTVAIDWYKETVDSDEFDVSGEVGVSTDVFAENEKEKSDAAETFDQTIGPSVNSMEEIEEASSEKVVEEKKRTETDSEHEETKGRSELDITDADISSDVDLEQIESEQADDFVSTIRTSLDEIPWDEESQGEFTATGENDLQIIADAATGHLDEDVLGDVAVEVEGESGEDEGETVLDFDLDEADMDATQKLDEILNELSEEDEEENGNKEG